MADVQANKGNNILANPDERKKFRARLHDMTTYLQQIDDLREGLKDAIASISADYGVEKKHVRKLVSTMHKANYNEQRKANQAFEAFYELIVEGALRNDDVKGDPLDNDVDDE